MADCLRCVDLDLRLSGSVSLLLNRGDLKLWLKIGLKFGLKRGLKLGLQIDLYLVGGCVSSVYILHGLVQLRLKEALERIDERVVAVYERILLLFDLCLDEAGGSLLLHRAAITDLRFHRGGGRDGGAGRGHGQQAVKQLVLHGGRRCGRHGFRLDLGFHLALEVES